MQGVVPCTTRRALETLPATATLVPHPQGATALGGPAEGALPLALEGVPPGLPR